MTNIKETKWRRYGGWIFVAPIVLNFFIERPNSFAYFLEVYIFGGFMAIVALFLAGKIGKQY